MIESERRADMPPAALYRYRSLSGDSFKYTQDIFLRHRLYLPLASSMNDVTEGRCGLEIPNLPLPTSITPMQELWAKGNFAWGMDIRRRQALQRFRLAAFSSTCDNPLLWAHYADSHRGICIGFRVERSTDLKSAVEVKYQDTPPVWRGEDSDLVQKVFCTKWSHWEYEKEWRTISTDRDYIELPRGVIETVILGVRTSKEDQDWVRDWVKMTGDTISIKKATLSESGYSIQIEAA